jgi:hypothetical protein
VLVPLLIAEASPWSSLNTGGIAEQSLLSSSEAAADRAAPERGCFQPSRANPRLSMAEVAGKEEVQRRMK